MHDPSCDCRYSESRLTRRELLRRSGMGLGMLGLAGLASAASPPRHRMPRRIRDIVIRWRRASLIFPSRPST